MINAYAVNVRKDIEDVKVKYLMSLTSDEKRNSIQKFYRLEDSKRALIADILIRTVIVSELNIKNKDIVFEKNEFGKPFLKGYTDFHFNISHSGDWVVCCTHCLPIGVDIEVIKNTDYKIAKRFFSEVEYNDLINKNHFCRLAYFYSIWTLKESYIKALGRGLAIPLNSFSFRILSDNILFETNIDSTNYYFKIYDLDTDYKTAICGVKDDFPASFTVVDMEDMEKLLRW